MKRCQGNRFTKSNRLLDAAAYGRVFEKATRSRDKLFTVLCRPNNDAVARLGLAISKKHCRRATARNRLKRLIRESFRHHQDELGGLDIVVLNQPSAKDAERLTIRESLVKHWQRCEQAKGQEK
ncbi:MAG: ribonuclease P protein component [Pseudomonadota bacterium]